jgi:hypothetical protein
MAQTFLQRPDLGGRLEGKVVEIALAVYVLKRRP